MSTQPEALRLADALEKYWAGESGHDRERQAAAELRRLHAEVERLTLNGIHTCHAECQRPVCRLTRERDALLEALNLIASDACADMPAMMQNIARAAIAKAEGEQA